ncbi:polyprenyl synthetase family protein, partial [candidate division KSB1 bacterium]
QVKETFSKYLRSHVRLINIITSHFVRRGGKNLRPLLVILSARMCGNPTPETYKAAALFEMLHNATLRY